MSYYLKEDCRYNAQCAYSERESQGGEHCSNGA